MADGVNIFDLAAKLSLDMKQFDQGMDSASKKADKLTSDIRRVDTATSRFAASLNRELGTALSGIVPGLSAFTTGGLAGAAVVGITGLSTAVTSAGAAIVTMANQAAQAGGEVHDLSRKVNFGAETISTLAAAAKRADVDFASISSTLGIFDKNFEKAAQGNKELQKAFKDLGVTARDNEAALRQAIAGIVGVGDSSKQTTLALEVFGRGGKEIVGLAKEMGGDLDAATEHYRRMGKVITEVDAVMSDRFSDSLQDIHDRLTGVTQQIGMRTLPAFVAFFEGVNDGLDKQAGKWTLWGDAVRTATTGSLGAFEGFAAGVNEAIKRYRASEWQRLLTLPFELPGITFEAGKDLSRRAQDIEAAEGLAASYKLPASMRPYSGLRGGGGTRGGGGATRVDPGRQLLERLQGTLAGLTPRTEAQKIETELLGKQYAKLNPLLADTIRETAKLIDVKRRLNSEAELVARQTKIEADALASFNARQREALRQARSGPMTPLDEVDQFRAAFNKLGGVLGDNELILMRLDAMGVQVAKTSQRVREELERVAETTPPIFVKGLPGLGAAGAVAAEITGVTIERMDRELEAHRDRMEEFAASTTFILGEALHIGFRDGMTAGLREFEIGLLRMIESSALRAFQQTMANVLIGLIAPSASGGGVLGILAKIILPILGGTVAGGVFGGGGVGGKGGSDTGGTAGKGFGFAGSFASGGTIPMGQWGIVHEGEKVWANPRGAQVIPNPDGNGKGSVVNHYHSWNVSTPDAQSFARRETQTQIRNRMMRGLRGT